MTSFHARRALLFLFVAFNSTPCWAIIVFKKNQDEPIRGFLISENETSIKVHELLPNGEMTEHILPRVSIDDIIQAVDPKRLEMLKPEEPEDYRRYAEDLAAKTEDPEARVMAIRLYLIAAYLKSSELGRSCLLGMAGLARSPAEERAFRAMAFSLDPDHDPSLLRPPKVTASSATDTNDKDRQALRVALRLLRSGKLKDARRHFSRPSVQATARRYAHILSEEEYQQAIAASGQLNPQLLRKFLMLEITLTPGSPAISIDKPTDIIPWSTLIARDETDPTIPQSLIKMTEFDPRLSLFRKGMWVRP